MLKTGQLSRSTYFLIILSALVEIAILLLIAQQANPVFIVLLGLVPPILVMTKELIEQKKTDIDDADAKLTKQTMKEIHEKVMKTTGELENKQKVISHFLRYGVVKEQDLIEALNQQSFVIFYHYNRAMDEDFVPYLPENKTFSKVILKELGFVPVGATYGSYFFHVISSKALPRPLDDIVYLEAYIKKRMFDYWVKLESNLKQDPTQYEKFKKNKRKKGNLSYFLGKIFPSNLSIGYINFSSFDKRFLEYCSRFVNSKDLEIDTQELKSIIQLASLEVFIGSIEPKDRKKICQNESKIKDELGIESLFDYTSIDEEVWKKVLLPYFDENKATNYSKIISSRTKEYCPIIKEFL